MVESSPATTAPVAQDDTASRTTSSAPMCSTVVQARKAATRELAENVVVTRRPVLGSRRSGYVVAIAVMDPLDLSETGSALEVLLSQPIVGVVVLDFHRYDQAALLERLAGVSITTVTSDDDGGFRHVVIDDRRAARELAEYLLSLGHQTVHHVSVPGTNGHLHPREVGWREALEAAGAAVPDPIQTDWSIESGRAAGAVLAQNPSVTAVVCANDELAFGVMRSLRDAGRSIPDDVSVAGMDDQPLADAWVPALTTYRLDFDWAGVAALRLLLEPKRSRVAPDPTALHVIARGTTAAPRRGVQSRRTSDFTSDSYGIPAPTNLGFRDGGTPAVSPSPDPGPPGTGLQ